MVPPLGPGHAGPVRMIIDSTALKMVGDGERHMLKYKSANKRRCWLKPHRGVDAKGFIVASEPTERGLDYASVGIAMTPGHGPGIERVTADGAYDTRAVHEALAAAGGRRNTVVIPRTGRMRPCPRLATTCSGSATQREAVGRRRWPGEAAAHQQAPAENAMLRYKPIVGEALRARTTAAQMTETRIAVSVLNRMSTLGTPRSEVVVP